jgi:hypothetical protein
MLVGTDIAQCGDLAVKPDETNRITTRTHPLQNHSVGQISHRGYWLELGIASRRIENGAGSAGHRDALLEESWPASDTLLPPKC